MSDQNKETPTNEETPVDPKGGRAHMDSSVLEQLKIMRAEQRQEMQAMYLMLKELRGTVGQLKEELDKKPDSEELKASLKVVENHFEELADSLGTAFDHVGEGLGTISGRIQKQVIDQTNRLWTGIDNLTAQVEARTAQRFEEVKKEIKYAEHAIETNLSGRFGH